MSRAKEPIHPSICYHEMFPNGDSQYIYKNGLSKLEYFAAKALQGILANQFTINAISEDNEIEDCDKAVAESAIAAAKALIIALDSEGEQ